MYRLIFAFLILWSVLPSFSQNFEISISMKTRNDTVHLTHVFASDERNLRLDTTIIMKDGKGVFRGNRVLPSGLYWIVNDQRKLFQVLIGDHQQFGIEVDTADFVNGVKFISSPDNEVFYEFFLNDIQRQRAQSQLIEEFQNAVDDTERYAIHARFQASSQERIELLNRLVSENEGLFVSRFLKALIPLDIPDHPRDESGAITDHGYVYKWYRANFFSNFDIFDHGLLRTPMYEGKLKEYLRWFSQNHPPDTVNVEIDRLLSKALENSEIFRFMLVTTYNHFVTDEGLAARDNYFVHILDNWYAPYAEWATNLDEIIDEAEKVRYTLVGKIAPPLAQLLVFPPEHFKAAEIDDEIKSDLHAGYIIDDFRTYIESKFLIVLFWDVNCGGCRDVIQSLWELYEATKDNGLKVITVQTNWEAKPRWVDFKNQHGMFDSGWLNAWIIYDNAWTSLYNTGIVPIMYVLNDKKEIVFKGRNLDLDWLQQWIINFSAE